jgi:cation diffusion facilitator CzcD-associated flavoprotein CzcO
MTDSSDGLARHEARLAQDLVCLGYPPPAWVRPRAHPTLGPAKDVVVIGAGMCGLATGFALLKAGIANIRILDKAPAGREGPWLTSARMQTLRTPKEMTGPCLGITALTFRAFYEARFGEAAWATLGKCPRPLWMECLAWYRRVLALPVENDTRLERIVPDGGLFRLELRRHDRTETMAARKVVLATGREGLGGFRVPATIAGLPAERWATTNAAIDFARLAGKRVAVVGGGATAFDNAAMALEAGASQVTMILRQTRMPLIHKFLPFAAPGFVHGFGDAPDELRWRSILFPTRAGVPAPRESVLRCSRHQNFSIRFGQALQSAHGAVDGVTLVTAIDQFEVDFVIAATGFLVDLERTPELASFANEIARWSDRYAPPGGEEHDENAMFPYLGGAFEFTERHVGRAPFLRDIHCFSNAASQSLGFISSDVPGLSEGAQRLAAGIASHFFVADAPAHYEDIRNFARAELTGDEWEPRLPSVQGRGQRGG